MTEHTPGVCAHCGHPLRDHRGQRPVYDRRMMFRCRCGCTIDGTAAVLQSGDPRTETTDG